MKKKLFLIIIATLCIFLNVNAQLSTLRNFGIFDYKAGTQNWNIQQGFNDVMFFANNSGLLAYDGAGWFLEPVPNLTAVRAMLCDPRRAKVYVGASDELGYFEGNKERNGMKYHSYTSLLPKNKKNFGEIWNIYNYGKDVVFQSKNELFILQGGKMLCIPSTYRIDCSANINGKLIVATRHGIYILKGSKLELLPGTEVLMNKIIRAVMPLNGKIAFVTDSDGMFIFDGNSTVPYAEDITPLLKAEHIFCAATNGTYIAFGTIKRGVIVRNIKTGATLFANALSGLQNNTVLSMAFDRTGNLWMGLDNGISYMMTEMPYSPLLDVKNSNGAGYASQVYGTKLYLGTNQGLYYVGYPLRNSITPPVPNEVEGISGQVWSLKVIDGTLFCGNDNGAYIISDTHAKRIEGTEGTWSFVKLKSHPDCILAGDYRGFYILKKSSGGYSVTNRIAGLDIVSAVFYEAKDGTIWVSDWKNGVYQVWLNDDLTKVVRKEFYRKGNVLAVSEGNQLCYIDGEIYISSADGFYHYNTKKKKLAFDSAMGKIFNHFGTSLMVMELPNKDLLATTGEFVAVAHPGAGGYKVDSTTYMGVAKHLRLGLGHFGILDSGRTILNSQNGFLVMRNKYKVSSENSRILISAIRSSGNRDSIIYRYADNQGIKVKKVVIEHDKNSIAIDFVMPEYRDEHAVIYQCFLEGYDKGWTDEQLTTSKEYTRLPKGTYTFHVKARNLITGNTEVTELQIEILPAWYETWWAYLIYIIIGLLILQYTFIWIRKRAQKEMIRVKKEQEQKMKEQKRLMEEQRIRFEMENAKKEKELALLRTGQLELELKHKVSELADYNINLTRKNDMLQELDQQMCDLSESVRREDAKARITKKIKDIRHDIKMNMEEDDNWDKFEQNFNIVYDDFMMKLDQKYPDLKLIDKKLCAYLRMGLSSKEMAQLLNTSERSIETARYRLRKKLGLGSGENLGEFIKILNAKNDGEENNAAITKKD